MLPHAALVLTTIADPVILDDYLKNFERFGHLERVAMFIIPDRKTPSSVFERCAKLRHAGLQVACPTLEEQEMFLRRFDGLSRLIPYNSDNRRNVGFLMALESEAEFMISIDDDNYCLPNEDFFAAHSIVAGETVCGCSINSSSGWLNICEMLVTEPAVKIYPRGFPYFARHKSQDVWHTTQQGRVHMNAGLWLSEPDLDAMTWLVSPVRATGMRGDSVLLGDRTWSPINTQNTAIHRDVIVSYYYIRMGYPLGGMVIDRFGDVISGYFSQACVRHLGNLIKVGTPIAEHRRNSHDYMKDAANEFACIRVFEDITEWLVDFKLEGANYFEAYASLADGLQDAVESFSGIVWNDSTRGYFHQMAYCMRQWIGACKQIS